MKKLTVFWSIFWRRFTLLKVQKMITKRISQYFWMVFYKWNDRTVLWSACKLHNSSTFRALNVTHSRLQHFVSLMMLPRLCTDHVLYMSSYQQDCTQTTYPQSSGSLACKWNPNWAILVCISIYGQLHDPWNDLKKWHMNWPMKSHELTNEITVIKKWMCGWCYY